MKWIAQRGDDDCGIAAVAMALGLEYEEAEGELGDSVGRLQATRAISEKTERIAAQEHPNREYIAALVRLGLRQGKAVRLLYSAEDCPEDQVAKIAEVYLASVHSDYVTGLHAVAIDNDGTVFDPQ